MLVKDNKSHEGKNEVMSITNICWCGIDKL